MKKVAVIISVTSDIGLVLARKYLADGYTVVGTYRSKKLLGKLSGLAHLHLFFCDISNKKSIGKFIRWYDGLRLPWDVFISCPCNPLPVKPFFKGNFEEWSNSIHVNCIEQMRVLHNIYPYKRKGKVVDIVFFAGGGVNGPVINFSAYTVSKIMLIKMCEFLDAENKDINIFIVGPGWTRTKTHEFVLQYVDRKDERYQKIVEFLKSGKGTSMDDIYECIRWLCAKGREIASGRNFSVVNDKWKGPLSQRLIGELMRDTDMYKLRRYKNDFLMM